LTRGKPHRAGRMPDKPFADFGGKVQAELYREEGEMGQSNIKL